LVVKSVNAYWLRSNPLDAHPTTTGTHTMNIDAKRMNADDEIKTWRGHIVAGVHEPFWPDHNTTVPTLCGEKRAPLDQIRSGWPAKVHCSKCLDICKGKP
jgi:hypothetical protein